MMPRTSLSITCVLLKNKKHAINIIPKLRKDIGPIYFQPKNSVKKNNNTSIIEFRLSKFLNKLNITYDLNSSP